MTPRVIGPEANGTILRNLCEPIILRNCDAVFVLDPNVNGGPSNIRMEKCRNCWVLMASTYRPDGPNDPEGHGLVCDDCDNCGIVSSDHSCVTPSEDAICFFNSRGCQAWTNSIRGPKSPSGTGIVIDAGSQNCRVELNDIEHVSHPDGSKGVGICVAGGKGHRVGYNQTHGASIQVGLDSDKGRAVKGVLCIGNSEKPWIAPKATGVVVRRGKVKG